MLSVCLLACWYWQQKVTHLAGMDRWLCLDDCTCVCVCVRAHAWVAGWLSGWRSCCRWIIWQPPARWHTCSLVICVGRRVLFVLSRPSSCSYWYTHTHTHTHTHTCTYSPWWHSYYCDLLCLFLFWHLFCLPPSFLPRFHWAWSKISSGGSRAGLDYLYMWCHICTFVMISLKQTGFIS